MTTQSPTNARYAPSAQLPITGLWASVFAFGLILLPFAGYLKGAPGFSRLPVDLTIVGVALSLLGIALLARRVCHRIEDFFLLAILMLCILASAIPTAPLTDYATRKIVLTLTLFPLSLLSGYLLLQVERIRNAWLVSVVILGSLLAVLTLIFPDAASMASGRISLEGGNTTSTGRGLAAAAVVLFVNALNTRRYRVIATTGGAALLVTALATAARGPILAAIAATVLAAVLSNSNGRIKRLIVVMSGIAVAFIVTVTEEAISDRAFAIGGTSTNIRFNLWEAAGGIIRDNPLGVGWGLFYQYLPPNLVLDSGDRQYPHNVILELISEGGWITGLLMLSILALAALRQVKSSKSSTDNIMTALLVFFVASAMVAGDITDNRGMWLLMGSSLAAYPSSRQREPAHGNRSLKHAKTTSVQDTSNSPLPQDRLPR